MRIRPLLAFLVALCAISPAHAEERSEWVAEGNARARLIAGVGVGGRQWVALDLVLAPGFKTYWRDPGESGLPPLFAWDASTNVKSVAVRWPAPLRLEDSAGIANGYTGRLVLPFEITPETASNPIALRLKADFGICHDICIPVRLTLALDLVPGEVTEQPDALADALERVPREQALGSAGPLSILSVVRGGTADKALLDVTVRAPAASAPRLFVEAPPNWFMAVSDPSRAGLDRPDTRVFHVEIAERPREIPARVPLTITLAAEGSAIETELTLDAAELAR